MTAKPGPIVITLKNRLGPPRRLGDDDEPRADDDAGLGGSLGGADAGGALGDALSGGERARSRSRSRDRRSPSPPSPLRPPAIARSSVLNVASLEDIFARFHGQFDSWLQAESQKLERQETRGKNARDSLNDCADRICDFLREQAPRVYEELGPDPAGESFGARALPGFLEIIDEDRRALQEASGALAAFAERRFPKSEELAGLKSDSEASPVPLLKGILRQLKEPAHAKSGSRRARTNGDREEP